MQARYDHIDSLRGVAVLLVVLMHTGQTVSDLPYGTDFFTRYGQLGVQLFFVISGFTLCLSMDDRRQERFATVRFFIRRFFRIAPMYYFGILLYFLVRVAQASIPAGTLVFPERFDFFNVFSNIFFIHGFVPSANNGIVPGGWSIGTEMAFYAIFPLLFPVLSRLAQRSLNPLSVLVVLVLFCAMFVLGDTSFRAMDEGNEKFMYYNISNQIPVFFTGMVLYFWQKTTNLNTITLWVPIAGMIVLTAGVVTLWHSYTPFSVTLVPFLAGLSFVCLYLIFARTWVLNAFLLRHIGQLSFSIYIIHFVFARVLGTVFANLSDAGVSPEAILAMHFSLTAAVSYVLAFWTEKYIERPGTLLGRILIETLGRRIGRKTIVISPAG